MFHLQVTKSVISLLHYYGWKKFSIIYEESSTTVAKSLTEQAKSRNMTINHFQQVIDNHKCCEKNLACCRSSYWHQVSGLIQCFNFNIQKLQVKSHGLQLQISRDESPQFQTHHFGLKSMNMK